MAVKLLQSLLFLSGGGDCYPKVKSLHRMNNHTVFIYTVYG